MAEMGRLGISRRALTLGVAAAVAAPVLRAKAAAPKQSGSFVATTSGGATQDLLKAAIFDPFQADISVKVDLVSLNGTEALARMRAEAGNPSITMYFFSGAQELTAKRLGLTETVGDLGGFVPAEQYRDPDHMWAPAALLPMGIIYDKEKIPNPPKRWADFLAPEYQGHIAFPAMTNFLGPLFVVMLAISLGGSEDNIDPGFKALAKLAPQSTIFDRPAQLNQLFEDPQIWMVPYESGFAHRMMEAFPRLGYIFPEEGSPVVPMTWAIAKGAPNVEAARVAMAYAVRPEAQAKIVEILNWYPSNPAAADIPGVSDKVKRFSAQVASFVSVDRVKIDANRPQWVERFKREVASAR